MAKHNSSQYPGMFTILFFDEANSTEAIGTIKEIMCDYRMNGQDLEPNTGLKIIAACNPYKKHSENIIQNFEKSGLGFYVDMNDTQEKLGDLPMRHLVYRVQPLPASMCMLIWDFGHLTDEVEKLYITQIVYEKFNELNLEKNKLDILVSLLACSQKFMRSQNNECSFVSLRDIQRVIKLIKWFLKNGKEIFDQMDKSNKKKPTEKMASSQMSLKNAKSDSNEQDYVNDEDESEEEDDEEYQEANTDIEEEDIQLAMPSENSTNFIRSTILALNTCYHVGLQSENTREAYRTAISRCYTQNNQHQVTVEFILDEINTCYEVFLDEIKLPDAIARNQALKENIFMLLMCIELKIPLFIIGKPGSSKSLAKTLISQKMQGADRNNSIILSKFKESHLITFQCSPLSTSDMILNTFRYCAKYQLERMSDLDRYTSVVVLDEIGLAEASTSMPLKTLHPLLEDGVYFEEEEEQKFIQQMRQKKNSKTAQSSAKTVISPNEDWHQVGFIGISNWVLDPAKMNRGIFVNRCSPSIDELKDTVVGICKNDENVLKLLKKENLIDSLSNAYLKLCEIARSKTREFFGLRDFYSLIKMIYWHIKEHCEENDALLDWSFLDKAIRRNFGGLIDIDPVMPFIRQFKQDKISVNVHGTGKVSVIELIKEALLKKTTEDQNRYLLLLSQNDNALDLINNYILNEFESSNENNKASNVKIIFGSSFPNDQKYSQICRKIQ